MTAAPALAARVAMPLARLMNGVRRWLRRQEPATRALMERPFLARLRPWLERRQLLCLRREALARGTAAGLFCGLIPGPLQVPATVVACAGLRGNAVAGAAATLYTNPLTTLPLYALAFQVGAWVLPGEQTLPPWEGFSAAGGVEAVAAWMQALGAPLAVGLPLLALMFAVAGYAAVQALWLVPVWHRANRRR
ncbi:DUF2062 domain-containing protein [Acidovorax sp. GBBC 3334]|uniref:DUF2062 domain-containing protein n=1 Tax=Acidovorax sp. GBBC 3334 TaxID=2940496 RepID=UPI0023022227|nr:DUF2062 domain-containing protein [Acidovorax sp. GBBC 3334]MDA8455978.1 DUF2062 domain-containing protein [Acidovorax sp. GBBC 3334]